MLPGVAFLAQVFGVETGKFAALVLFGLAGLGMIGKGVLDLKTGYDIESNELVSAAAVESESGVVEVQGTATPLDGKTVTSPYTNTECLVYQSSVRERNHDHDEPRWETHGSSSDETPFLIEDDSGSVVVDPEGGEITLDSKEVDRVPQGRQFEGRIDVGETAHVYGTRKEGPVTDGGIGEGRAHVGDGDAASLKITDASKEEAVTGFAKDALWLLVFGTGLFGICTYALITDSTLLA